MGIIIELHTTAILTEALDPFDRSILQIIKQVYKKNNKLDFDMLYAACVKLIPNQEKDILLSIHKLLQLKYLIAETRLTKDEILQNPTRRRIYEYIRKHHGVHFRELFDTLNVGGALHRHLFMLKKFQLIRERSYLNKTCFFSDNAEETNDLKCITLRDTINQELFQVILSQKSLTLADLSRLTKTHRNTIQPHLEKLIEANLIKKETIQGTILYRPHEMSMADSQD